MKKCIYCNFDLVDDFYPSHPKAHKRCWKTRTYQLKLKIIYDYMMKRGGLRCSKCGYDNHPSSLCFHHRNPDEKDPKWNKQWAKAKLYKELDKCDILCLNCHQEHHAITSEYDHWTDMITKIKNDTWEIKK
jgi:hypothetical protein